MQTLDGTDRGQERTRLVLDRILLATDFSPASAVSFRYALALARHYQSTISMVPAAALDSIEAIEEDARHKALQVSRRRAPRWLAELRMSNELEGVRHEIVGTEAAEKALLGELRRQTFDLAINGVASRQGQTVLLDPTVEDAVRRSRCPVVNVGEYCEDPATGELKSILYATDFSAESLEAARYAFSLAQEFQARLTLLHVVEGLEPVLRNERARIAQPYRLWLEKLVPDLARLWCEVDFVVEFGRPAERILEAVWENHVDLVVLGARGLDRLSSPGRTARQVMSNAWCPVLTVSGELDDHKLDRFWRAAAAALESLAAENERSRLPLAS